VTKKRQDKVREVLHRIFYEAGQFLSRYQREFPSADATLSLVMVFSFMEGITEDICWIE